MTRSIEEILADVKAGRYTISDVDLDVEVVLDRKGERLTEARAREMAAAALRELGLRGRPSLSGERRKSPQISFRVPQRLAKRAEKVAAEEGKSLSQLGREALERYLEEARR